VKGGRRRTEAKWQEKLRLQLNEAPDLTRKKNVKLTRSGFIEVFGGCPVLRFISITGFTNPQVIDGTKEA
jgi:hypothetical protein